MKRKSLFKLILTVLVLGWVLALPVSEVVAAPVLQVWSPDWDLVGDFGEDEDTWLVLGNSANIQVLGEFKKEKTEITDLFLIVSAMPKEAADGEVLLYQPDMMGTMIDPLSGSPFLTKADIDAAIYSASTAWDDSGDGVEDLNNHYPFKEAESEFWVFALGDMENPLQDEPPDFGPDIPDYNAETGVIEDDNPNRGGAILEYFVTFEGYDGIHIDVVALVDDKAKMNPGSHDVTIPEPATIFLIGSGLLGLGLWKRRKFKS
jgi:hypothetical protein